MLDEVEAVAWGIIRVLLSAIIFLKTSVPSSPEKNVIAEDYSVFNPKVLQLARQNGDLKMPDKRIHSSPAARQPASTNRTSGVPNKNSASARNPSPRLKRATETPDSKTKRQRTEISTVVLETNVVDIEDSDDDDILVGQLTYIDFLPSVLIQLLVPLTLWLENG